MGTVVRANRQLPLAAIVESPRTGWTNAYWVPCTSAYPHWACPSGNKVCKLETRFPPYVRPPLLIGQRPQERLAARFGFGHEQFDPPDEVT